MSPGSTPFPSPSATGLLPDSAQKLERKKAKGAGIDTRTSRDTASLQDTTGRTFTFWGGIQRCNILHFHNFLDVVSMRASPCNNHTLLDLSLCLGDLWCSTLLVIWPQILLVVQLTKHLRQTHLNLICCC
ncbi:hypothetical protein E2C01_011223 [Portunus trituberculatus]|uniref:Uncharacterized protein n=1 Tax=Portunus trituberculatus TaxID=210409 RepID=A0A5B7DAU3_PORTR|nr:hypothetical protein [Portunus trituberculatus]